jgi:hypothetical protein
MIALVVTMGALLLTVWMLSMISWWLAMFWLVYVIAGVTWFVMNLGNKSSPDRWYDRVLLAPVMPLAWLFGQIDSRCALTIRE